MTVHHTAAVLDSNRKAPARARAHQRYHMDDRGWIDLAYHFLVDANGHVLEGRPLGAVGDTGTNYDPTGHFLVCAEGDFNQQAIPAAQVAAIADVLAWGAVTFGVPASTIRGHRDWASTSCPGDGFYPLIKEGSLQAAVETRMAAGAPSLSVLCGDAAISRVADIEAGLI
ncbi:MAG: peptidoglycan recognition protein family protein [Acidimicrobiia bacterium]|nr:peptidoglycan recognition protein family protein [Acidimicrobiia bacterium]